MAAINMPTRAPATLGALAEGVNAFSSIKNAFTSSAQQQSQSALQAQDVLTQQATVGKVQADTVAEQLENTKTQMGLDTAKSTIAQLNQQGSPLGESLKSGMKAQALLGQQAYPITDPNAQSAFQKSIAAFDDPNVTGMQAKQMADNNPVLKSMMDLGLKKLETGPTAARVDVMKGTLNEKMNENANDVGKEIENHPMVTQLKGTTNSIDRALSLINGKTPLTTSAFNATQNDFINALSPGGAATEGKVSRELMEPIAAKINEIKTKYGNVSDLRTAIPDVINNLRDQMYNVRDDYGQALAKQVKDLAQGYSASDNPKVQQILNQKIKRYTYQPSQRVGQDDSQVSGNGIHPALQNMSLGDLQALQQKMSNSNSSQKAAQ